MKRKGLLFFTMLAILVHHVLAHCFDLSKVVHDGGSALRNEDANLIHRKAKVCEEEAEIQWFLPHILPLGTSH